MFELNIAKPTICNFRTLATMALGVELSELVAADMVAVLVEGRRTSLSSIHFHGDSAQPEPGALIAATGATTATEQLLVIDLAASANASAVVVRKLSSPDAEKRCREMGIGLAVLDASVEWSHLIWFVRTMLDRGNVVSSELTAQQGLFAMADVIAAMLDAPVTIEDARNRVVAYSATTEGADAARTSTIMTRAVPPAVLRQLRATGALKKLAHENRPFIVPALEPGFRRRLVIPLRIGGQAVGSIWAIWDGDLNAQLETQLTATGTAAALTLVQLNASRNAAGRYSLEVIRTALRDGTTSASGTLDLPFMPVRVVALQRLSTIDPADDIALWLTYFRKKSWPDPIVADVDGRAFAIASERSGPGGWEWLRDLAHGGAPGRIAGSRPRSDIAELPAARREAAEALTAADTLGHQIAAYEEVWDTITLRRASAAMASVEQDQLRSLHRAERGGGPPLASTLLTWLECDRNIEETASALHLHPNTIRQRLKKIDQLVGSALPTHTHRLAALMLLRSWDEEQ
ncbi:PucR family transcriptional regulator [Mycobacterium sp. CBMA293]|nr:PucR family transcriptional regulator [Mycolicibacterium sp. CBMA 360]MUL58389.1 PucR family transcriptional regulator [Mycolicibacterium sp. CBMA 335]MUL73847.1 PucR family transcriptional regulator [Mycolicibacterium sp. CBMA 311]MUL93272.1 PucR family transcriptional regulator [Mycolicibacterium sp. CBMA 230]MUM07819.1 hypothetical protein [Mycolicibacterium sp. CBMA 213]MUM10115.1 PucR family transcriptional regulator [Mycolicibacterium sp. CBMA 293]